MPAPRVAREIGEGGSGALRDRMVDWAAASSMRRAAVDQIRKAITAPAPARPHVTGSWPPSWPGVAARTWAAALAITVPMPARSVSQATLRVLLNIAAEEM